MRSLLSLLNCFHSKKQRKPTAFKFYSLPLIVRNLVIQSMGKKEWILFAMTSKRTEKAVKLARIKLSIPLIVFGENSRYIDFHMNKVRLWFGEIENPETPNEVKIGREELKPWLSETSSVLENTEILFSHLQNSFLFDGHDLIFRENYKKTISMDDVFSSPILQNWKYCFYYENFDLEDFNKIMALAGPDHSFYCLTKEIPLDFQHENAFKFLNNEYEDARWVKVENLFVLENCTNVLLKQTHFKQEDFQIITDFWIHSQIDMFMWMSISTDQNVIFDSLLDQYLVLHYANSPVCYTLAKFTSESRKLTVLSFSWGAQSIIFCAWAPDEQYKTKENAFLDSERKFENAYEILKLLEEKNELEMGIEENEDKNKSELERLMQKLTNLNVFIVDGKATVFEVPAI